jgi:hypothetical protein
VEFPPFTAITVGKVIVYAFMASSLAIRQTAQRKTPTKKRPRMAAPARTPQKNSSYATVTSSAPAANCTVSPLVGVNEASTAPQNNRFPVVNASRMPVCVTAPHEPEGVAKVIVLVLAVAPLVAPGASH